MGCGLLLFSQKMLFYRRTFHYKSNKQNDVEKICADLGTQFGIKIKVAYARSGKETFNIKRIEW